MKFAVSRTSNFHNGDKPCDNATILCKNEWEETLWQIEINCLDELCEFINENGSIVLSSRRSSACDLYEIEIYDDYRE